MKGECYGCGDDNPIGLGLEFAPDGDRLRATFMPRPEHRGGPGLLHGGVAATVLDETMAALGFVLDDVHCMTATLELKYRKPVPLDGKPLTCESWRDRREASRRQRVHGRLLLHDGTVAVEAHGIFVQVPEANW
ncbi:MAG TPA: PaaI family thioesterase [Acidimicrobiales bacterium]|nr:PaaI family thioesterase [Acidimicrobiales bacterium]